MTEPGRLLFLFLLACVAMPAAGGASDAAMQDTAAAQVEHAPADVEALIATAEKLVTAATSGEADASRFRIDTVLFRESLRDLMLAEQEHSGGESARPRGQLMELVRMSALLQSAAECKTGRYIVCPPELQRQLRRQLARLQGTVGPKETTR